ncbi:MAG: diguanylate cyclase [Rickettsiales bacterium]|nr:diguanylate cyclase [Rickettsiales bacterium]
MKYSLPLHCFVFLIAFMLSCSSKRTSNKPLSLTGKTSLKFSSGINEIFQDSDGSYWLGSTQEGVAVYDGESYQYFSTAQGLMDNQIRSIQEDANGIIWIETAHGIHSYDGSSLISQTIADANESSIAWTKAPNDLWFGAGTQQGVYRFDGQVVSYLAFPNPEVINHPGEYLVNSFALGKNNMHWFGTYDGVIGYDGEGFVVIDDQLLDRNKENGLLHVRSVLEDSQGRLWIGNNGIGVMVREGDSITHFSKELDVLMPIKEFLTNTQSGQFANNTELQSVFAIEEDGDGNIWFGDRDTGAWKYDGQSLKNYRINENLKSQMVVDIYLDKQNNLLFGMAEGGVYRFNGESFDRMF